MSVRQRVAPVARAAVKAGAAAADLVLRPEPGIVILIYHRVGCGAGGQMDLDPAAFDEQLAWLRSEHRVITLDAAADELAAGGTAADELAAGGTAADELAAGGTAADEPAAGGTADSTRPGVVLTFDDGTTDWVDVVLPALERHQVPATFYVATDFVDRGVPFPGDGPPLSWSGVAELASSPWVTVGSHTHRHALLDRLDPASVAEELDRSTELLAERAGVEATHFAYPKAVAGSPTAEAAVRERFRTAVLAGTRPNHRGADLHRLARSPVQPADGRTWFRRKARGGMRAEDDLRRAINVVRYRGASS